MKSNRAVVFLHLSQSLHACVFEHEDVYAFLVSVTVCEHISADCVGVIHTVSFAFIPLIYRFDIYGLSPDADEDETGIKRASENSKYKSESLNIC